MTVTLRSVVVAAVFGSVADGRAQTANAPPPGQHDYLRYCAAGHGGGGKGDGPVAPSLRVAPTDLTKLSRREGAFNKSAVLAAIDGRREIAAHGSREMPVWGAIFESELRQEGKHYPVYLSLLKSAALVEYLPGIQGTK